MHYKCEIITQVQTNFNSFNCSEIAKHTKTQTENYKSTVNDNNNNNGQTDHDVDDVAEAWSRAKAFGFVGQTDRYGEAD